MLAGVCIGFSAVDGLAMGSRPFDSRPVMLRSSPPQMSTARRAQVGALGAGLVAAVGSVANAAEPRSAPWSLSTFLDAIDADQVEKVSFAADGKQASHTNVIVILRHPGSLLHVPPPPLGTQFSENPECLPPQKSHFIVIVTAQSIRLRHAFP